MLGQNRQIFGVKFAKVIPALFIVLGSLGNFGRSGVKTSFRQLVADAAKTLCHSKAVIRRIERNNQGNKRLESLAVVGSEQHGQGRLTLEATGHRKVLRHQGIHWQTELWGENTLLGKLAPDGPAGASGGNEHQCVAQIDRATVPPAQQNSRNLCGKGIFLCEGDYRLQSSGEDGRSGGKAESGGCHNQAILKRRYRNFPSKE